MRCLCCGKELRENASAMERECCWHKNCIKRFFGTNQMPMIQVTNSRMEFLAESMVNKGLTVPGVQKKLSLHLSVEKEARLTIVDYPTGYILKPQTEEYETLPEYEDLSMRLAEICGIKVVPHALIKMENEYAYITRRIDRDITDEQVKMYAMEDFCQVSQRLTQDKYKGSYEACGKLIRRYSVQSGLDISELFLRVVFSFVIGNSDMHLKNFSLIETEPKSRMFKLSDAYDMLPVNVVLPEDTEQMALALNGKKRNLRKRDFKVFGESCRIDEKASERMIANICNHRKKLLQECERSYLSADNKRKIIELIESRIEILGG